ncbi:MAG TPA: M28 family metallopeptidase [Isosphaeraceae bacterium]|jgi:Zn-dependent M28 family amino/carboxypeptidase|nr:M28 family metallopeptidase [Isosphaeraceae bacterium]
MDRNALRWSVFITFTFLTMGAAGSDPVLTPAFRMIDGKDLLKHIQVLSSDTFEGRGPGTVGEKYTVDYLIDAFKSFNLKPGNPDGTFLQKVPLVGFRSKATGSIKVGDKTIDLAFPKDWVAVSRRMAPQVKVNDSDVVFVGYGVVAPEYGWDDYKGVDVRGKTIVMLINDPAVPDPNDASKLDPALFKGKAMTYYGRWTYKYEIASEKGAAAAIIVHENGPAGYPFEVVVGSWGRENFDIPSPDRNQGRVSLEAWMTLDKAKELFTAAGKDFDDLKKAATRKDFEPVPLGAKAKFDVQNTVREIQSQNVLAKLVGSDPKLKDEYVVYTAHWDHLGKDEALTGDKIYNGAADNASGVAGLLEIAEGFTRLHPSPKRSILFLAVTAEEKGLLGARYYAEHPLYPLSKTVADINMDVLNLWGRTSDILSIGFGNSTLDDVLTAAASQQGRTVQPDAEPEKGLFYRSDHFEFAKQGVPALDPKSGMSYVGKPADFGRRKRDEYTQVDYHKVTDEVKHDWDLSGALDDLRLLLDVGYRVAQAPAFPEWKPGTEFKARREAMLKPATH